MYLVIDQNSNAVTLRNDGVKISSAVNPTLGSPTVALWANGSRVRLSQANATAWGLSGPTPPATMYDADGNTLVFALPMTPYHLGGYSEGAYGTRH
jgi:hypothetical protein